MDILVRYSELPGENIFLKFAATKYWLAPPAEPASLLTPSLWAIVVVTVPMGLPWDE